MDRSTWKSGLKSGGKVILVSGARSGRGSDSSYEGGPSGSVLDDDGVFLDMVT